MILSDLFSKNLTFFLVHAVIGNVKVLQIAVVGCFPDLFTKLPIPLVPERVEASIEESDPLVVPDSLCQYLPTLSLDLVPT